MRNLVAGVVALVLLSACASAESESAPPPDRIALAESAGPASIASAATIVDYASGAPVELRKGTNEWVCLPDDPATPDIDPMCLDKVWQEWMTALEHKTKPNITRIGLSYMLQGGSAASNDDPFATDPPAGQARIYDGPHVMILVPDPGMLNGMSHDPASGGPYVMWGGTDYAHIMMPIAPPNAAAGRR